MRYLIQFVDKSSMIVSQREGELAGQALVDGKKIVLRGAMINPHFISIIKPIERGWFNKDFVEDQNRKELAGDTSIHFLEASHGDV